MRSVLVPVIIICQCYIALSIHVSMQLGIGWSYNIEVVGGLHSREQG